MPRSHAFKKKQDGNTLISPNPVHERRDAYGEVKKSIEKDEENGQRNGAAGEDTIVERATQQVVADIGRQYALVSIKAIRPNPYQPRLAIDPVKLQQLAKSIQEDGLLEPVILRRVKNESGVHELVAGERRWRAATLAGLETIPAEVLEECGDSKMRRVALIENLLREQLTPIELAQAYKDLLDERDEQGKTVYTIRSLADALHQTRDQIDSHLALLRVPEKVRQLIIDDPTVPLRIIREVGNVEDPADQELLVEEVRKRSLNQADIVAILQVYKQTRKEKKEKEKVAQPDAQASPIAQAIFLRKFQTEQAQFSKSLSRISSSWSKLGQHERTEIHTCLRERIQLLEEMLRSHPVDLSV
jgi:ParB family chromosome partitioning protein